MKLFRIPKKKPQRILSEEEELYIKNNLKSLEEKQANEEAYVQRYINLINKSEKEVSIDLTPTIRGLMAQYYLMGLNDGKTYSHYKSILNNSL